MGEIIEKGECGGMIEEGGVKDVSAKRKRHEPVRLYKAKVDRSKKGGVVYTLDAGTGLLGCWAKRCFQVGLGRKEEAKRRVLWDP